MAELRLDMHRRERTNFAADFRKLADTANELADAIDKEEDALATVQFAILTIIGPSFTSKFDAVVREAIEVLELNKKLE